MILLARDPLLGEKTPMFRREHPPPLDRHDGAERRTALQSIPAAAARANRLSGDSGKLKS